MSVRAVLICDRRRHSADDVAMSVRAVLIYDRRRHSADDVGQSRPRLRPATSQRSSRLLLFSVVITDNLIAALINGAAHQGRQPVNYTLMIYLAASVSSATVTCYML